MGNTTDKTSVVNAEIAAAVDQQVATSQQQVRFEHMLVPFDLLDPGDNVRLPDVGDVNARSMADSIEAEALKHPLTVMRTATGRFLIACGHIRHSGIGIVKDRNASRFSELFGEGVPCSVMINPTIEQYRNLLLDHGEEHPLTSEWELYKSAIAFFANGATERDVAIGLNTLMTTVAGNAITADRKSKIAAHNKAKDDDIAGFEAAIKVATAKGDTKAVQDAEAGIRYITRKTVDLVNDEIAEARRGYVQMLHNIARSPHVVMDALLYRETGNLPNGYEEGSLPTSITTGSIKTLAKAHMSDIKDDDNWNAGRPGPKFRKAWLKVMAQSDKKAKATADGENRPKAMSATALLDTLPTLASESQKLAVRAAAGQDVDGDRRKELDKVAYVAEILFDHDSEFWTGTCIPRFEECMKAIKKADEVVDVDEAEAEAEAEETELVVNAAPTVELEQAAGEEAPEAKDKDKVEAKDKKSRKSSK